MQETVVLGFVQGLVKKGKTTSGIQLVDAT